MQLTRTPDVDVPPFEFVPAEFDPTDLDALAGLVSSLVERPIESPDELRKFVYDWGEVSSKIWADWARHMTAMNRDTRDEGLKEANLAYQKSVMPAWMTHEDKLNHRYLDSPHRAGLGDEFAVFDRQKATAAEIFRQENTQLIAKDKELGAKFDEIQGAVLVEFRGEKLTVQQCCAHFRDTDRATRQEAYLALFARMAQDRDQLDDVLDEQISVRRKVGANAGFDSFRDFRFAEMYRFDYTPQDCEGFHAAVEKIVVPVADKLMEDRRRRLGLETLRPWDLEANLFGGEPRKIFEDQEQYIALTSKLFDAVDPVFAADFDILVRNGLLDLMSRPGKAPGGYNCPVEDIRLPFIFWNAVGRPTDLRVLLHEGGHAFHTLAVRDIPVSEYRQAPTEFCEVASMSMELFALERLGEVFDEGEVRELAYDHLVKALLGLMSIARTDAFQHWMYANPDHTREERRSRWTDLSIRYQTGVDWSGYEEIRANSWQMIPHLFGAPLYYIEYGIAQLGAFQLWLHEREDHAAAVGAYRRALALGGSRPLPELFETAGIRFAMDEAILAELVPQVMERISAYAG